MVRHSLVDETRDSILGLLSDGSYAVGDRLLNEQKMGERLDVSRATIREAYRSLIGAGYLQARRGSGTFVLRTPNQPSLDSSLSYMAMIAEAGLEPGIELVRREERAATKLEAERLQRVHGESRLLVLDRIHTADGHPVIFSRDRVPTELVAPSTFGDLSGSLYSMMEAAGHEPRSALSRLAPVRADEQIAGLLRVGVGDPLLHIDEVDFDADVDPVLYSEEWHVGTAFPLWLHRRVTLHNDPY